MERREETDRESRSEGRREIGREEFMVGGGESRGGEDEAEKEQKIEETKERNDGFAVCESHGAEPQGRRGLSVGGLKLSVCVCARACVCMWVCAHCVFKLKINAYVFVSLYMCACLHAACVCVCVCVATCYGW